MGKLSEIGNACVIVSLVHIIDRDSFTAPMREPLVPSQPYLVSRLTQSGTQKNGKTVQGTCPETVTHLILTVAIPLSRHMLVSRAVTLMSVAATGGAELTQLWLPTSDMSPYP